MRGLCSLAALLGAGALFLLVIHVVVNGVAALSIPLFTEMPAPIGTPGGGMAHAFVGSIIIVGLACLWGIPAGLLAGIYLADYQTPRLGGFVRFTADVLTGIPSIVFGIFGYILVVTRFGGFSGLAAAFTLGVITLPIVARTTEETLRLVPHELREAALALGVRRWRVVLSIVLPTARAGLITGAMLALARAAGETAPLIFTTLGNNFWNVDPTRPMAAVTLTIFQYAIWPYKNLHEQAWAASLILLLVVLLINLTVRLAARSAPSR
ncbi:MAG: phosphate transport system permease protein [Chloroflexota bacterium]|nr:phosphate transport system permease protein [Chloroflexota bacterium]